MQKEKIELLNSEGPILTLRKKVSYELHFHESGENVTLEYQKLKDFLSGKITIITEGDKNWNYNEFSDGMKPDQTKLREFMNDH
jgi:hypothetical protein